MANNDTCYYCIDGGPTGQWEVGLGTYADPDLLTRTTIYSNSNGDTSAVNFSAGTKDVFITNPATQVNQTSSGTWTPIIEGTTSAGTGTYSTNTAEYIKIGNLVYVSIQINWSAHTGTGDVRLSGFPYPFGTLYPVFTVAANNLTFSGQLVARAGLSVSYVYLQTFTTGGALSAVAMDTAAALFISGTYITP